MTKAEKKLAAKAEEFKANEIDLVAKVEELKKARTAIEQLGGELARLCEEVRSLRPQLEQTKATTTKAVFKYQTSEEMAALRKPLLDEGFETGA